MKKAYAVSIIGIIYIVIMTGILELLFYSR